MGKTALITGAARRIGKSMVNHLARKGWNIAIHYNTSNSEAENLCFDLRKKFSTQQFETFQANLNNCQEVEKLIPEVYQRFGSIDLLINNASAFEPAKLADTSSALINKIFTINLIAPFIICREFILLSGRGIIINLVDTRISTNETNYAAYSLSKKALWELTKMLAVEFGPSIRVNAIAPGLILPPEGKDNDYLQKLADEIPMKQPGGTVPVLQALDYIVENEYLTGQLLFCDGGENLI
jgi:pteridine reductase